MVAESGILIETSRAQRAWASRSSVWLVGVALLAVVVHVLTNGQYGWHRDELATLDDARYLDWGYVAYPPIVPFVAGLGLDLFGASLVGVRLFSDLALAAAIVLTGLMARELGGSTRAQIAAAVAVAVSPVVILQGSVYMYVTLDYLCWVVAAYLMIRLLKSGDPRYWLGIGAAIGLGMMTKYTMAFFVAGIVAGVLVTRARRSLLSPWLWGGVAVALLVYLPNLVWQAQHEFISLEFLTSIHARDIAWGRTGSFLPEQLAFCANPLTIPLWVAGLYYYLRSRDGAPYRAIGWAFVVTLGLLLVSQGRSYYLAPAYPMLLAAGCVVWDRWLGRLSERQARVAGRATWAALAVGGLLFLPIALPVAPVNSGLWKTMVAVHGLYVEEIGWPELAQTVAGVYNALPADERARTGILTGNYGEAGALNLYGRPLGLPEAIGGTNSYWLRGYGDPAPEHLIVVGFTPSYADRFFEGCSEAATQANQYGVSNEETEYHSQILFCEGPRQPWPELWPSLRNFG